MHWNHRLMQRIEGQGTAYEETFLYIVECYYNTEDNNIIGWTEKEEVWGESVDEVRQTLHWMLDALDKPILIEADLLQRMEEINAMGGDAHDIGINELGDIDLGELYSSYDTPAEDEEYLDCLLPNWEDDGGYPGFPVWDQD